MSSGFADTVAAVLRSSRIAPPSLTLEITETVLVRDSERSLLVLNELKEQGVLLALDDFGTGYSSLSYLRQFPIDVVKVDRTFVADLGKDSATDIIVSAVIKLVHDLGMTSVAEGVETSDQHQHITALGCDSCQGYYFGKPMPAEDIDKLLIVRAAP